MNSIIIEDLKNIKESLTEIEIEKFRNSSILITGCAGFLGFYFMHFFSSISEEFNIKKIIGIDNFIVGHPNWLVKLENKKDIYIYDFNIINDKIENIPNSKDVDFVIHMASIASPKFYRKFPIQTLDANIWGLRNLFDYYKNQQLKGILFFSSSEIYGDPTSENIPTDEEYRGNVSCLGPRANYDEAKRFGETMCYIFNQEYKMPITIARPFNNFGPGMRLNDARVPADFAKSIWKNQDITMFSDGTPTRTFCYISDAITGYLKVLLYPEFNYFNIGIDFPEISIKQLAEIYIDIGKKHFGYEKKLILGVSEEKDYLKHNPSRRCPNISKARNLLGYSPKISVEEGVFRFLKFVHDLKEEDLIW
jgi:UDP-glucuronate decarboxylase